VGERYGEGAGSGHRALCGRADGFPLGLGCRGFSSAVSADTSFESWGRPRFFGELCACSQISGGGT